MQPGEYPNTPLKMVKETQIDMPQRHIGSNIGLFQLRMNDDIAVFTGCGLGGTSLINAGVSLRVLPRLLADKRWPEPIRIELSNGNGNSKYGGWEDYYSMAEGMLKPATYPESYPALPKMEAMKKAAAALNLPFARVPIAVTFEKLKGGVNQFGVPQEPCIACGDCAAGCNHGAKNTVLMNYLPDAKQHGAEIFCGIEVRHLERRGDSWAIHCKDSKTGRNILLESETVIVAAGTLGTNEILLRSREKGLKTSDHLGSQFSGNGDVVGWSYNTNYGINGLAFGNKSPEGRAPVGPFASSIIDAREKDNFLIIEGSFPGGMARGVAGLLTMLSMTGTDTRGPRPILSRIKEKARIATSLLNPYWGATHRTQTYLVVNEDNNLGKIYMQGDRARIDWPNIGLDPIFDRSREMMMGATKALGGTFMTQMKGKKQALLTGHASGGVFMSDTAETGVSNHKGQIFSNAAGGETHPGLYAMDASLFPISIGVNPLLTITALAERCCRTLAADRGWTIDYSSKHPQ